MDRLSLIREIAALVAAAATNSMLLVNFDSKCPDCWLSRYAVGQPQVVREHIVPEALDHLSSDPSWDSSSAHSPRCPRRVNSTTTPRGTSQRTAGFFHQERAVQEFLDQVRQSCIGPSRTGSSPSRRSEIRRDKVSRTSTTADISPKNRRRLSSPQRVLCSRSGFRMEGRDIELGKTQSARHIHGGYHGLVRGARNRRES